MPAEPSSGSRARAARRSGIVVPNNPKWYQRLAAALVWLVVNAIAITVRFRVHDPHGYLKRTDIGQSIFCVWHNRLALSAKVYHRFGDRQQPTAGLVCLVSASKDGALLSDIFRRFGLQPVRGSSSRRGGQALLELTTWAERGYDIAITPDGPRGPKYQIAGGATTLAQFTGLPLVPVSYYVNWKIQLKSWDAFQIPLPFSRCEITVGEVVFVSREADDAERERLRQKLETDLRAITRD